MFYRSILPALFPFFVISSFAADSGISDFLGKPLKGILRKHFSINSGEYTYMISALSGYPNSARIISAGRNDGIISRRDAQILLILCSNGSSAFIISYIGSIIPENSTAAYILLFTNYISPLICAKILCGKINMINEPVSPDSTHNNSNYISAFISSVTSSTVSVLNVGAFIIFFSVLRSAVELTASSSLLSILFTSVMELSAGCRIISETFTDVAVMTAFLGFLVGFGGICVIFQCLAFIGNTDLDKGLFVRYKLLCGIVNGTISFVLAKILCNDTVNVSADFLTGYTLNMANILLLGLLFFIILLYYTKKDSENKT